MSPPANSTTLLSRFGWHLAVRRRPDSLRAVAHSLQPRSKHQREAAARASLLRRTSGAHRRHSRSMPLRFVSRSCCSGVCSRAVSRNSVVRARPPAAPPTQAWLHRTGACLGLRCAVMRGIPRVIVPARRSPVSEPVLLQPLAGDAFHGLIPILVPLLFDSQSFDGAPEKAKSTGAVDGAQQFGATGAIVPFLGKVLHHSPLVDVCPVGQRQNTIVC